MTAIYKMTNTLNGKLYVGQTTQPLEKRFLQHSKARTPLGEAMRQCRLENFTIEVIEECATPAQTRERERFWIRVLKCKVPNGYNQSDGGEATHTGKRNRAPQINLSKQSAGSMTVSESLRRFRKQFNLSQGDVASTLGMMQQSYFRYESGKISPRSEDIIKLADAYNVTTDYLLGRSDEPCPPELDAATLELVKTLQEWADTRSTLRDTVQNESGAVEHK